MGKKAKKITEDVVDDIASEINDAVEVFSDAAMKTAEVFSDAVSRVAEKQNSFLLKRHSSKQEHYLFAKRETKLGPGIYTVTDKKKDNKYNTLLDQQDPDSFARITMQSHGDRSVLSINTRPKRKAYSARKPRNMTM